jgi:hypothetical protein
MPSRVAQVALSPCSLLLSEFTFWIALIISCKSQMKMEVKTDRPSTIKRGKKKKKNFQKSCRCPFGQRGAPHPPFAYCEAAVCAWQVSRPTAKRRQSNGARDAKKIFPRE